MCGLLNAQYVDMCTQDASASENEASCQQRYSSVIRRRVAVATAMFTRRAGGGSAEALRAGARRSADRGSEVQIVGPEQKLRLRARAGSAEARGCSSGDVH